LFGFVGQPRVNVLAVNRALDVRFAAQRKKDG
jgi:K+-transporting ATPase ATPase C chain